MQKLLLVYLVKYPLKSQFSPKKKRKKNQHLIPIVTFYFCLYTWLYFLISYVNIYGSIKRWKIRISFLFIPTFLWVIFLVHMLTCIIICLTNCLGIQCIFPGLSSGLCTVEGLSNSRMLVGCGAAHLWVKRTTV